MMLFEQAQIVVRRVKNQFTTVEHIKEGIKIDGRERVHEFVAVSGADLDEADFFRVGVEAVGFGIERKPLSGAEFRKQRREFYISINHVGTSLANRRPKEKASRLHKSDLGRQPDPGVGFCKYLIVNDFQPRFSKLRRGIVSDRLFKPFTA